MVRDEYLWECIKEDDEKAFSELFHRYFSRVYKNAFSFIRDEEVCEQIAHDIFLSIWKNRKVLVVRTFEAYLTAASRYMVYKYLAKRKIIPLKYTDSLETLQEQTVQNNGYYDMTYENLEEELEYHLRSLPKRCREIFLMSRKECWSNEEIAKKLGISKRSVENQLTYALKHLRVSLRHISILCIFVFVTIS